MKPNFKFALILSLFALICFTSCQNEVFEETQNQDQTIDPNSTVANLMRSTASNNVFVDNVMDDSNCFSVNLPVTIIANGITITIDSLEDLELLEDIFNEFSDDDDFLEFIFPITIILNDYTEITIENEAQLEAFIAECNNDVDVIECVDFVYPISFTIYNTQFQVIDHVVIESDEELYYFLENLQDSNDNVVIASLDFPVRLKYSNGTIVEVHNNQELEAAINAAEEFCDDDDEQCDIDDINMYLLECHWKLDQLNATDLHHIKFFFNANGSVEVKNSQTNAIVHGNWSTTQTDEGIVLTLTELTGFADDFNGEWLITECDDDDLSLVLTSGSSDLHIELDRICENDIECSAQEISVNLQECKWYAGTDLFQNVASESFEFFANGVVVVTNDPSGNTTEGTYDIILTDEGVFLVLDFQNEPLSLISLEWRIIECSNDRIKGVNGDHYLVFEQDCNNNSNPFECFDNMTITKCDDDVLDGFTEFNLEMVFPNCPNDDVEVSFHASLGDAQTDVEQLPSLYTNTSNPQTIYARIALAGNNSEFEIVEVGLYVEDCSPDVCTEEDVDGYLMECTWIVANYNGSDDLSIFDLHFGANQDLVITADNQTITAGWSTSQSTNGVILEFSNVSGANIQAITGIWTIVECQENRLEMVMDNDFMVLERICN